MKDSKITTAIACEICQTPYPAEGAPYGCPKCGGTFDWQADFHWCAPSPTPLFESIWRWAPAFHPVESENPVSLGEGNTPLIPDIYQGQHIYYKMESMNPTGSYKDRASSVLTTFLRNRGVTEAVEDSSGNAGASFAAYAARAGIKAGIYVPASASGPKRRQIETYGARLVPVNGPRSAAAEAVLKAATGGVIYASHAYQPFGMAGIATIAYELVEQLGRLPGTVIAPAGHASLILGILRGFRAMVTAGRCELTPHLIAVQSSACAPLLAAWNRQPLPLSEGSTIAEGVKVIKPARMAALIREMDPARDQVLAFNDENILAARTELAERGIDVEPTSALAWCAMVGSVRKLPEPIVLVLTGSGLKYAEN